MITEQTTKEACAEFSTAIVSTLYAIAIVEQKYIFAKWVNEILITRGISQKEINSFTENFKGFYEDLLTQDNL
jgi:hypothetical protein